mmetsp:Transcript_24077/g.66744  ORF Transcript_24077/g.66744 Transcript_24077/m.66744 type:complete len:218 (-) Transcript_24077:58-711(-)
MSVVVAGGGCWVGVVDLIVIPSHYFSIAVHQLIVLVGAHILEKRPAWLLRDRISRRSIPEMQDLGNVGEARHTITASFFSPFDFDFHRPACNTVALDFGSCENPWILVSIHVPPTRSSFPDSEDKFCVMATLPWQRVDPCLCCRWSCIQFGIVSISVETTIVAADWILTCWVKICCALAFALFQRQNKDFLLRRFGFLDISELPRIVGVVEFICICI